MRHLALAPLLLSLGCTPPPTPEGPSVPIDGPAPAPSSGPAEPPARGRLTLAQKLRAEELLSALARADDDARTRLIDGLRDEVGGAGLAMALDTVVAEPAQRRWQQTKRILDRLRALADPDAADALATWADAKDRSPHWRGVAGAALAESGDLRGARLLGERLRLAPKALYDRDQFWQADAGGHLSKTDRSRIVAARLLSELAHMHPEAHAKLRRAAEAATAAWLQERPQPHANGLRFLAAAHSEALREQLRRWAFPTEPLPAPGALPPFPAAYERAQNALRYLGWMRDAPSLSPMVAQLKRKDPATDIRMNALVSNNLAMHGMALRAVGYGAAQGLAQWGPEAWPAAREALVALAEDPTWQEDAREAACEATAFMAPADWLATLPAKVARLGASSAPADHVTARCWLRTLRRTEAASRADLLAALRAVSTDDLRWDVARALGRLALDASTVTELRALSLDGPATLAVLLGGSADATIATLKRLPSEAAVTDLADAYYQSFGTILERDLTAGTLSRWVRNAQAADAAGIPWLLERLSSQLDNMVFDQGPHTLTRNVARFRLLAAARRGPPSRREEAIELLAAMRERGALMSLARDPAEHAALASRALERLKARPASSP